MALSVPQTIFSKQWCRRFADNTIGNAAWKSIFGKVEELRQTCRKVSADVHRACSRATVVIGPLVVVLREA